MNRLNIKKLWPTIALALLASCATDVEQEAQQGGVAIRLTAEEQTAAAPTRAASTADLQNTAFAAGEDVAVYVVDRANASTYASTPYRFRASAVDGAGQNALTYYSDATTASVLCYPITPSASVDIYGFYPYSLFASVSDRTTDDLAISVSADQSTAAAYRASDVMMATAITDQARTESTVGLTFRHLMAKLVVRLKQGTHAGTSSAITAASLVGSILTIGGVTTEATLNMTDGTVTTGSNATTVTADATDLAFYYDNADAVIGSTEYAIVLPAQALSSANVVTITTAAGETISGTLPAITLTAGSSTVLTLTVNDSGIEATRESYGNGGSKTWANYPLLSAATAEDKGKLICTDGHIHAYNADAECTANRVAKIIYVGSSTGDATYTHGLALALADEGAMDWNTAISTCSGKNTSTAVANASWMLASQEQWQTMGAIQNSSTYYALRGGFSSVGGTNLQSGYYWSSTASGALAWYFRYDDCMWGYMNNYRDYRVRACLAF